MSFLPPSPLLDPSRRTTGSNRVCRRRRGSTKEIISRRVSSFFLRQVCTIVIPKRIKPPLPLFLERVTDRQTDKIGGSRCAVPYRQQSAQVKLFEKNHFKILSLKNLVLRITIAKWCREVWLQAVAMHCHGNTVSQLRCVITSMGSSAR